MSQEAMKTLYMLTLMLSGVLTPSHMKVFSYEVKYLNYPICAVRGFNVSVPCTYSYTNLNPKIQVKQMLWCSMNSNIDVCENPPYVYNSALNTKSDFVYTGDDISDCTLLIHNVQFNYSGEYKFRFITNVDAGKWTGNPGVTLQVTDLKVSLIRLSGNGTLKHGDSLNLTCDVNCTQSSSQFVWSKNNIQLQTSGPVLHFPALTLRDSGNYTCTWKTDTASGSKSVLVQVEDEAEGRIWVVVLVIGLLIVVIVVAVIYRRRTRVEKEEESGKSVEKTQTKPELNCVSQADDETGNIEEVTYATVFVKNNKLKSRHIDTKQAEEDDSVIYSTVIKS